MQSNPHQTLNHRPASEPSRPFLKWVGGKQRLLNQLRQHLPSGKRLIEPFVGAGSVFLGCNYPAYLLNDANPDLVAVWVALKHRPAQFIRDSGQFFAPQYHSKDAYLQVRSDFNQFIDRYERAIRLPYLNKFGFNGLFRVSRNGGFNVPYGRPAKLPSLDVARMEAAALKLQRAEVWSGGYKPALEQAGPNDVVYCDPPYSDSALGVTFTKYTGSGFTPADHEQLVAEAHRAAERGSVVLISNHLTPHTLNLYLGMEVRELLVRRSLSASTASRVITPEVLAIARSSSISPRS